ncbi:MAG: hypothetical protein M3Y27_09690 [Acidobacteriota bacterium]|nr:hypothetical protein [Acidobacteriota bacterium]
MTTHDQGGAAVDRWLETVEALGGERFIATQALFCYARRFSESCSHRPHREDGCFDGHAVEIETGGVLE